MSNPPLSLLVMSSPLALVPNPSGVLWCVLWPQNLSFVISPPIPLSMPSEKNSIPGMGICSGGCRVLLHPNTPDLIKANMVYIGKPWLVYQALWIWCVSMLGWNKSLPVYTVALQDQLPIPALHLACSTFGLSPLHIFSSLLYYYCLDLHLTPAPR